MSFLPCYNVTHRGHTLPSASFPNMSTDNKRKAAPKAKGRYFTGVSLEPEVVAYVDELAARMGLNRSFVINTIVYEYAKLMEKRNLKPLSGSIASIRL